MEAARQEAGDVDVRAVQKLAHRPRTENTSTNWSTGEKLSATITRSTAPPPSTPRQGW
jgi:hypothetical protein